MDFVDDCPRKKNPKNFSHKWVQSFQFQLLFSRITDIPRSVWRLLCNPVYMVLVIGGCCEICIVSGFCVFLPKYLETQFGISKSAANLLTGIVFIVFILL